jgi:predicted O-methyltransferase YrrM
MGLATVLGIAQRGYFIPYRFASDTIGPERADSVPYPEIECLFQSASNTIDAALGDIESHGTALAGIAAEGGGGRTGARFDQEWFPRLDAAAAYALVRGGAPRRIVEIGCGHSTRFMARAIADGGLTTEYIAIDPSPRASLPDTGIRHIAATLGSALESGGADAIGALGPGDILFVDSSHILMPGTDLDLILNRVLPGLAPGVIVHFHDIFLPDGYPVAWAWRGYNEQSAVAALLGGGGWRIRFASRYVATRMAARIGSGPLAALPLAPTAFENSLWLERVTG